MAVEAEGVEAEEAAGVTEGMAAAGLRARALARSVEGRLASCWVRVEVEEMAAAAAAELRAHAPHRSPHESRACSWSRACVYYAMRGGRQGPCAAATTGGHPVATPKRPNA